jgi:hypothetical protein
VQQLEQLLWSAMRASYLALMLTGVIGIVPASTRAVVV